MSIENEMQEAEVVYENAMHDLETLGTRPGCVVMSIGAVAFDPMSPVPIGPSFYRVVSLSSCTAVGLTVDTQTLEWWQGPEVSDSARDLLLQIAMPTAVPLPQALAEYAQFLSSLGPEVRVWGNGADFDQPILQEAYVACGMEVPWKFYNSRCYRTLKNLRCDIGIGRMGMHHNALDDALSQAWHAVQLLRALS